MILYCTALCDMPARTQLNYQYNILIKYTLGEHFSVFKSDINVSTVVVQCVSSEPPIVTKDMFKTRK